jgi:hypothetical protein
VICHDKKLLACKAPVHGRIHDLKNKTIPALQVEKDTLPTQIQACAVSERRTEESVLAIHKQLGESQGAITAHWSHIESTMAILSDLETEHRQFASLEPLVTEAIPQVLIELRSYLRNNELRLQEHLADLTDELGMETDHTRARTLRFRIRSLNEMSALRLQTSGFATIDQVISGALNPKASHEELGHLLLSPLSLELFKAARDGARSLLDGADAFRRIERAWVRAERELQGVIEETKTALVRVQVGLPELMYSKTTAEESYHAKQSECDHLRKRRDTGVEDDLARAKKDIHTLHDRIDDCRDDYCTNCASLIGWG